MEGHHYSMLWVCSAAWAFKMFKQPQTDESSTLPLRSRHRGEVIHLK